jgi:DnaJ-class molecular chaperone
MSGCHEPTKNTRDLIIEFIDNCNQSFDELENLIKINEAGLNKCFEWLERLESDYNSKRGIRKDLNDSLLAIQEEYKNKIQEVGEKTDAINNRLRNADLWMLNKQSVIEKIESGYIVRIGYLANALQCLSEENEKLRKIPHRCPVCNGAGEWKLQSIEETINNDNKLFKTCHSCGGKGVLWG